MSFLNMLTALGKSSPSSTGTGAKPAQSPDKESSRIADLIAGGSAMRKNPPIDDLTAFSAIPKTPRKNSDTNGGDGKPKEGGPTKADPNKPTSQQKEEDSCGPNAVANALGSDPQKMVEKGQQSGAYQPGQGTSEEGEQQMMKDSGVKDAHVKQDAKADDVVNALKKGEKVVFNVEGHALAAAGLTSDGKVIVKDSGTGETKTLSKEELEQEQGGIKSMVSGKKTA